MNGQVIPSERPNHVIHENWNPLGNIGIISAFNFPNAVLGWNASLALITGNQMLWKGSESTNLVSVATTKIIVDVLERNNLPGGIFNLIVGDGLIGSRLVEDKRINLVSFTGSTKVGRSVGEKVAARFGKSLLELGGNNAVVVMDDADIELAYRACTFSAAGTCG